MDEQPVALLPIPDFEHLLKTLLDSGTSLNDSCNLIHKSVVSDSFGSWFEADAGMDAD